MKGIILVLLILTQIGCSKSHNTENIIPIPNGDFENWDNFPRLLNWQTNSCPICTPAFETYIVLKDANAYRGQFAAKFIYNNVYSSWANNNFAVSEHPSTLTAYVKCNLASSDTVRVKINLHKNLLLVDSGYWAGSSLILNYTKIVIPITQNNISVDSAMIRIEGGKKISTELWVDNLQLFRSL